MEGRTEEGVDWLRALEPDRIKGTGLAIHLWWHLALFLIEMGEPEQALALYDRQIMATVGAEDFEGSDHSLGSLDRYLVEGSGDNHTVTKEVGRAAIHALHAFGTGDFSRTIALLLPIRHALSRIGGSHAQRDLWAQILITAAIEGGHLPLARALCAERVALRPRSQRTHALQADVLSRLATG